MTPPDRWPLRHGTKQKQLAPKEALTGADKQFIRIFETILLGDNPTIGGATMRRNNWLMTRLETAMFLAGVTLMAGGAVWATAIR